MSREIRRRLRRKGLDARAIKVYAHLHSHCFSGPTCWPSQKLIGERCGMSRQLVNAVCQQLREAGVLEWEHRHVRGSKYPCNVYRLRYWSRPKIAGTLRVLRRRECPNSGLPDTKGQPSRALTPLRDEQPMGQATGDGYRFLSAYVWSTSAVVEGASNCRRKDEMNPSRDTQAPDRLPQTDYPSLRELLDDVTVLGFWVQRAALAWVPEPPTREWLELGHLEASLEQLERAAGVARLKVQWRRKVAEAERDRTEAAEAQAALEAEWNQQEPRFDSPTPALNARSTAR